MKNMWRMQMAVLTVFVLFGWAIGQEPAVDHLSVPFSDPGKPGRLEIDLSNGNIIISGYDGKDVDIEAMTTLKKVARDKEVPEKAKGLTRIPVSSSEFSVEEKSNVMQIRSETSSNSLNLNIKVPVNTSLDLSTDHSGDISVENVSGEIEVQNEHGGITLIGVSGSIVASAEHDDITVIVSKTYPDRIMSFSNVRGDIDVTLPAGTAANLKVKTTDGDIFTGFEIEEKKSPGRIVKEKDHREDGRHEVTIDRAFLGTIGGGGPEIQFTTYHGDIYIRKGK